MVATPSGQAVDPRTGQLTPEWHHYFANIQSLVRQLEQLTSQIGGIGEEVGSLGTAALRDIGVTGETVPLLNGANTWSKSQTFDVVELVSGASIPWDWSDGPIGTLDLAHNGTLDAPTGLNGKAGTWSLFIRQASPGGFTLAYNAAYLFPGGNDPTLSTASAALDVLTCVTDGTSIVCSLSKAFA